MLQRSFVWYIHLLHCTCTCFISLTVEIVTCSAKEREGMEAMKGRLQLDASTRMVDQKTRAPKLSYAARGLKYVDCKGIPTV